MRLQAVIFASLCTAAMATSIVHGQSPSNRDLRPPAAFADIRDPTARSRALFTEVAKVITNPRCS
jgi:hypothetical protein